MLDVVAWSPRGHHCFLWWLQLSRSQQLLPLRWWAQLSSAFQMDCAKSGLISRRCCLFRLSYERLKLLAQLSRCHADSHVSWSPTFGSTYASFAFGRSPRSWYCLLELSTEWAHSRNQMPSDLVDYLAWPILWLVSGSQWRRRMTWEGHSLIIVTAFV